MKLFSHALMFAVSVLLTTSAFAKTEIVCESRVDSVETTIVVTETSQKNLVMKIYRSIHGHTVAPQEKSVKQLPASRGPVVAFGNSDQSVVLSLNYLSRNSRGETVGTFLDTTVSNNQLQVSCK
jgi:hypothetical protein